MRKLDDDELCVVSETAIKIAEQIDTGISRVAQWLDFGDGYVARVSVGLHTKEQMDAMRANPCDS